MSCAFKLWFQFQLAPLHKGKSMEGRSVRVRDLPQIHCRIFRHQGRAVQVHPAKPKLKVPGFQRLKLIVSKFCQLYSILELFNFVQRFVRIYSTLFNLV